MLEIERKFRVAGDYKHLANRSMHLVQGYIASGRRTVRVRIADDRAWLTIKGPSKDGGLSRFEWEKEIGVAEAKELMTLAEGAVIEKYRHLVEYRGHTFEVDEFTGDNEGLILAEVELERCDEKPPLPSWCGDEVTGVRCFYNSFLSKHPFKEWKKR